MKFFPPLSPPDFSSDFLKRRGFFFFFFVDVEKFLFPFPLGGGNPSFSPFSVSLEKDGCSQEPAVSLGCPLLFFFHSEEEFLPLWSLRDVIPYPSFSVGFFFLAPSAARCFTRRSPLFPKSSSQFFFLVVLFYRHSTRPLPPPFSPGGE